MKWLSRKKREEDLERELRSDLELEAEELRERGLSAEESRYAARRAFGNTSYVKEEVREVWRWTALEQILQDARYAVRTLRRSPGFTITAIAVLALAIGANAAMFSVLNTVVLRPLPYRSPEQLAMLWTEDPTEKLREGRSALWDVEQWRSQSQSFADMATFDAVSTMLTGADGVEQILGASISPNLLSLLGIRPVLGRSFSTEEAEQRQRRVLISHRFWQARFGGSHDALGATLVLNGFPCQIIGILPADFQIARLDADVWELQTSRPTVRGAETWFVVGRLRPAVTFDQAQAEMSTVAHRLNVQLPAAERNRSISVVPLSLYVVGPQSRLALWILGGTVFCVFLIAAANVTSLSLARGVTRAREIAVRAALGASAGRIIRQLLTEGVLLSGVSGLIGTPLASVGIRLIRAFGPGNLPRLNEVRLDLPVLGWVLVISLLAGILVGLSPAMMILRRDLRPSGEEGGRSVSGGAAASRIRRALVVADFALAIVLLAGAGLLVRSLWYVNSIDPGFRPERVLGMEISAPPTFSIPAQRTDLYHRVLETIQALPGVENAGIIGDLFIANSREQVVTVERDNGIASERLQFVRDEVSADFFKAMGNAAAPRPVLFDRGWAGCSAGRDHQRCNGSALVAWARSSGQKVQVGPAGIGPPLVHSRGRRGRHAAARAGARIVPADVRVALAESSSAQRGSFHTNLVR
jgi:predicted permease